MHPKAQSPRDQYGNYPEFTANLKAGRWVLDLLKFRQYDGLTLQFYDENGVSHNEELDGFVDELKQKMVEPAIAPRKCAFFR